MSELVSVFRRAVLFLGCLFVALAFHHDPAAAQRIGPGPEIEARGDGDAAVRLRERADLARARARADSAPPALVGTRSLRAGGSAPLRRLKAGELVSASERRSRALRIVLNDDKARIKRTRLDESFVPRGVDFDAERRLLAIAAVSRVLLYQVDDNELTVIVPEDGFGFANDVLFDDDKLIVADMGDELTGQYPKDGVIWGYELESGELGQIAERRAFSNPKLLAHDSRGRIHIVDGEAGAPITPLLELRYDLLYRVKGARQKLARPIFQGRGLLASAYAIDAGDRHWFANVDEIAILESPGQELTFPCGVGSGFEFVTGIAFAPDGQGHLLDGSGIQSPRRTIYTVDDECSVRERVNGVRISEARGLAVVEEVVEE